MQWHWLINRRNRLVSALWCGWWINDSFSLEITLWAWFLETIFHGSDLVLIWTDSLIWWLLFNNGRRSTSWSRWVEHWRTLDIILLLLRRLCNSGVLGLWVLLDALGEWRSPPILSVIYVLMRLLRLWGCTSFNYQNYLQFKYLPNLFSYFSRFIFMKLPKCCDKSFKCVLRFSSGCFYKYVWSLTIAASKSSLLLNSSIIYLISRSSFFNPTYCCWPKLVSAWDYDYPKLGTVSLRFLDG